MARSRRIDVVVAGGGDVEKVLAVDPENEKFSLGIKYLSPDPWQQVANEHPVGSLVKGRITSLTDFGAFVEIREGVEGMIHISEVSSGKIDNLASVLSVGQEVEAMILRLNPEQKKIGLSIKALEEAQEKRTVATHEKGSEKVGTNLGDLLKGLQDRNKG